MWFNWGSVVLLFIFVVKCVVTVEVGVHSVSVSKLLFIFHK